MMQTINSIHLPELIKIFDFKSTHEKAVSDVSDVNLERPAKIKLRDAREALEIARLKVLVSEMRERTMNMEVQLLSAHQGPEGDTHSSSADKSIADSVRKQEAIGQTSIEGLHSHINELQFDVDGMLLELSQMPTVEKELASAKDTIKELLEGIKDDAGHTKAQLIVLKRQLGELEEKQEADTQKELEVQRALDMSTALEKEMKELRKSNEELMQSNKDLSRKLRHVLQEAENIPRVTKDDVIASQVEVSRLRAANGELLQKVESLQMSRFNEVEELVYLRWVNACLRHDLDVHRASRRNSNDVANHGNTCSPKLPHCSPLQKSGSPLSSQGSSSNPPIGVPHGHIENSHMSPQRPQHHVTRDGAQCWSPHTPLADTSNACQRSPVVQPAMQRNPWELAQMQSMLTHRSASSDVSMSTAAASNSILGRLGRSFDRSSSNVSMSSEPSMRVFSKQLGIPKNPHMGNAEWLLGTLSSKSPNSISSQSLNVRPLRRHSASSGMSFLDEYLQSTKATQSPKGKPISRFSAVLPHNERFSNSKYNLSPTSRELVAACVKNNPSHKSFEQEDSSDRVVTAFQVLSASAHSKSMQHRTFKDLSRQSSHIEDESAADKNMSSTHYNLDSEFQRAEDDAGHPTHSSECQSCQSDASSSQAEFLYDLVKAIDETTEYKSIENVAAFVNWFDRQCDMDKQQFYSFPNCPRDRVDAMRRAVYEYEDLVALERELKSFREDRQRPPDLLFKGMATVLEKAENHVKCFTQARELAIAQFTQLDVPTYWMLDSGMIAKIKRASSKLAETYMKRMTAILDVGKDSDTPRDQLLLQAAKFLMQVHNFAGGFDERMANAFKLFQAKANLHVPLQEGSM